MPLHTNEMPFDHLGGYLQVEVVGSGTAQLQVNSGQNWVNCGEPLSEGVYCDLFKPAIYRFSLTDATAFTR
ncbi:TPA: hypothetical protein RUZ39_001681 [Vibrio cholerae]|nr:hypothetical protein [Vibrio cholerae]